LAKIPNCPFKSKEDLKVKITEVVEKLVGSGMPNVV
jgi:hypothetical protein